MTYDNYLKELKDKLSFLESVSDRASGLDERLDITNKLLFSMVDILREGMKLQLAPTPSSALPPYNARQHDYVLQFRELHRNRNGSRRPE